MDSASVFSENGKSLPLFLSPDGGRSLDDCLDDVLSQHGLAGIFDAEGNFLILLQLSCLPLLPILHHCVLQIHRSYKTKYKNLSHCNTSPSCSSNTPTSYKTKYKNLSHCNTSPPCSSNTLHKALCHALLSPQLEVMTLTCLSERILTAFIQGYLEKVWNKIGEPAGLHKHTSSRANKETRLTVR